MFPLISQMTADFVFVFFCENQHNLQEIFRCKKMNNTLPAFIISTLRPNLHPGTMWYPGGFVKW